VAVNSLQSLRSGVSVFFYFSLHLVIKTEFSCFVPSVVHCVAEFTYSHTLVGFASVTHARKNY